MSRMSFGSQLQLVVTCHSLKSLSILYSERHRSLPADEDERRAIGLVAFSSSARIHAELRLLGRRLSVVCDRSQVVEL
jgi:hypothetical protein